MSRLLSYTEVSTALTCFAQWDFSYGGHLTGGDTLKTREVAPILSGGRAWGAAVAAWHSTGGELLGELLGEWQAYEALGRSLLEDADSMRERGFEPDLEALVQQRDTLGQILDHYMTTAERLPNLAQLEGELNVPVPSRTGGRRGSSRYRFHCYLDGHTEMDHPWIVEFKLRNKLTDRVVIERQPQYRWYALAYALTHGVTGPVGVLLDERLNQPPLPARIVNGKKKGTKTVSHAVDQLTTPERYIAACAEYEVEPQPGTVDALQARRWQQRVPLIFTPSDLREAAQELQAASQLIRDLDSGKLFPIRNGKGPNCKNCRFAGICPDPTNSWLIDSLYERTVPKRLREPKPEGVR